MWSTARALWTPRRAGPIGLGALALLATEAWATRDLRPIAALGVFLFAFALTVPAAWRLWLRADAHRRAPYLAMTLGICLALVGLLVGAGSWLGYESYVAHPPAAAAIVALVALAGYVLGQDVEMSEGLAQVTRRRDDLESEVESARLLAIRNHLDPHFLFNTLSAIAEWCHEDPAVAERALLELSAMLRTLFDGIRQPRWPLSRELELLRALHALYALRDDERYVLTSSFDADDVEVPPLVFLPVFENAITHGSGQGETQLKVTSRGGEVRFDLWNAGEYSGPREGGTGIETTRRRLRSCYGDAATLTVEPASRDGVPGTRTQIVLSS